MNVKQECQHERHFWKFVFLMLVITFHVGQFSLSPSATGVVGCYPAVPSLHGSVLLCLQGAVP